MAEHEVSHPLSDSMDSDRNILDAHRLLVMWLFICSLSAGIPFLILVLYFDATGRGGVTIMIPVMVAGAGGAFVSSLRRLYGFEDIFPRRNYLRLFRRLDFYVIACSLVPALVGIIGAIMIYLIFAGGLLKGDLFPEFICAPDKNCDDFHGFVSNGMPKDAAANAKAIVWGFIAGFSERFVPNILNRLATDKEKGARHWALVDRTRPGRLQWCSPVPTRGSNAICCSAGVRCWPEARHAPGAMGVPLSVVERTWGWGVVDFGYGPFGEVAARIHDHHLMPHGEPSVRATKTVKSP